MRMRIALAALAAAFCVATAVATLTTVKHVRTAVSSQWQPTTHI
jgi:hypothetical protein